VNQLPQRKPNRLKDYDYSQNGAYYITICTENRAEIFSNIAPVPVRQGLCSCRLKLCSCRLNLTEKGEIIANELLNLQNRYEELTIDKYVIMPDHIHVIFILQRRETYTQERQEQSPCHTVMDIVCAYKSITTKVLNKADNIQGRKIWQTSFYDHIVRNEEDYIRIAKYIDNNPVKWQEDRFYIHDPKRSPALL
jgi:REP element-mobilizing transposase RayT